MIDLEWSEDLATGIESVDVGLKQLIGMINQLKCGPYCQCLKYCGELAQISEAVNNWHAQSMGALIAISGGKMPIDFIVANDKLHMELNFLRQSCEDGKLEKHTHVLVYAKLAILNNANRIREILTHLGR